MVWWRQTQQSSYTSVGRGVPTTALRNVRRIPGPARACLRRLLLPLNGTPVEPTLGTVRRFFVLWGGVSLALASACSSSPTSPTGPTPTSDSASPGRSISLTIVSQPLSQTVTSRTSATLSVVGNSVGSISYQWYVGSTGATSIPVSGATDASFTTPALTTTTSYWVRLLDANGVADSETATITVDTAAPPPPNESPPNESPPEESPPEESSPEESRPEESQPEESPPEEPSPEEPPPPPPPPPPAVETNAAWEQQVITLVNQHRASGATCGGTAYPPVSPLSMDTALRSAARDHSEDMGLNNYFSHDSQDGTSFAQRIANAGYSGGFPRGENIAAGHSSPSSAVNGWMASTSHCTNIPLCQ